MIDRPEAERRSVHSRLQAIEHTQFTERAVVEQFALFMD
jgi:hypothetical protein